jgi:hypothetical protein
MAYCGKLRAHPQIRGETNKILAHRLQTEKHFGDICFPGKHLYSTRLYIITSERTVIVAVIVVITPLRLTLKSALKKQETASVV